MTTSTIKGIILAGGQGTRLYPLTHAVSKQLMPVFDKPMIYYPLSVLMLAGIREIAIITRPEDQTQFQRALGDGTDWGLTLTYLTQDEPRGLAEAYTIAEDWLDGARSAMILGDNIFFGHDLTKLLRQAASVERGGMVFGYHVADPRRYGVVAFDAAGAIQSIEEKPDSPKSNYALTGLYFLDGEAPRRARAVTPSARGEVEIVDLLQGYVDEGTLSLALMGRGYAWLDTGTHASLLDAGMFVKTLQERQDLQTGCPEEIAYQAGWIDAGQLRALAERYGKTSYGSYLMRLAGG